MPGLPSLVDRKTLGRGVAGPPLLEASLVAGPADAVIVPKEVAQGLPDGAVRDGILPGGTARGAGGVKLKVKVQCTDWIDIDRVQVLVNGRQRQDLNFTRKRHPDQFGDGVVKFERTIDVPLTQDAHLIVVAVGEDFTLSTGYGTSAQSRLKPVAYHNPIFVDVDGSGFTPNGDLLDWALPVKKLTVEQVRKLTAN